MTTAVVAGALANKAGFGGEAWIRTSWVTGLRRLGVDAWLVEDLDARSCVDRDGRPAPAAASYNVAYFEEVVAWFGLADRAILLVGGDVVHGDPAAFAGLAETADLVINIGGHLPAATIFPGARRVFVDIDPGWTQWWQESGLDAGLGGHDAYYTIAEHLGAPGCPIPTNDLPWRTIRQPVVLEDWPAEPGPGPDRFTTVATWRNAFGPVGPEGPDGHAFGSKHREFRRFASLPRGSVAVHELALRIDRADVADRDLLTRNGWRIVDPDDVARTPDEFRSYVQGSGAELSATQGVYAATDSGWFSDRTARYLASGRPAVVQDTGLADLYPVGEGLLTFDSVGSALAAERRLERDYEGHCQAARDLAERFFDSDVVLGRLLDEVGVS